MQKIVILDYSTSNVYITSYNEAIYEDVFEFIEVLNEQFDLDLKESQCNWMTSPGALTIINL